MSIIKKAGPDAVGITSLRTNYHVYVVGGFYKAIFYPKRICQAIWAVLEKAVKLSLNPKRRCSNYIWQSVHSEVTTRTAS